MPELLREGLRSSCTPSRWGGQVPARTGGGVGSREGSKVCTGFCPRRACWASADRDSRRVMPWTAYEPAQRRRCRVGSGLISDSHPGQVACAACQTRHVPRPAAAPENQGELGAQWQQQAAAGPLPAFSRSIRRLGTEDELGGGGVSFENTGLGCWAKGGCVVKLRGGGMAPLTGDGCPEKGEEGCPGVGNLIPACGGRNREGWPGPPAPLTPGWEGRNPCRRLGSAMFCLRRAR